MLDNLEQVGEVNISFTVRQSNMSSTYLGEQQDRGRAGDPRNNSSNAHFRPSDMRTSTPRPTNMTRELNSNWREPYRARWLDTESHSEGKHEHPPSGYAFTSGKRLDVAPTASDKVQSSLISTEPTDATHDNTDSNTVTVTITPQINTIFENPCEFPRENRRARIQYTSSKRSRRAGGYGRCVSEMCENKGHVEF